MLLNSFLLWSPSVSETAFKSQWLFFLWQTKDIQFPEICINLFSLNNITKRQTYRVTALCLYVTLSVSGSLFYVHTSASWPIRGNCWPTSAWAFWIIDKWRAVFLALQKVFGRVDHGILVSRPRLPTFKDTYLGSFYKPGKQLLIAAHLSYIRSIL